MSKISHLPAGYHTVIPYITAADAEGLIELLAHVFGARQTERHDLPDGRIMHAEVRIDDSTLMISGACEQAGPSPSCLYVYVQDVDAVYGRAIEAGCTSVMGPADMFWGDRFASVRDTWGNTWNLATHVEDVAPDEISRRAKAFMEQGNPSS